jgi:hypothetical protein
MIINILRDIIIQRHIDPNYDVQQHVTLYTYNSISANALEIRSVQSP